MDYFKINRISNSDLSRFKAEIILGQDYKQPERALNFGKAFHALLLEPHVPIEHYPTVNYNLIESLVSKVKDDPFCKRHLKIGSKEKIILFDDPATLAKCKVKLDLQSSSLKGKRKTIIDYKTTYAKDYALFLKDLLQYDYDRQAAFYTDSIQADNFILIGVQKILPSDIFFFEATKATGFVEYGRKKYKALLKKYVEYYNLSANGYYKLAS